ncbi:MAG TPA: hypothetical protein VF059_09645, partial [Casimicrobiaceae bacterium]
MRASQDGVEFVAAEKMHVVARRDQRGEEVAETLPAASGTLGSNRSGVVDPVSVDHRRNAPRDEQACAGDRCIDTIRPNHRFEVDVARLPPQIVAAFRTRAERTPLTRFRRCERRIADMGRLQVAYAFTAQQTIERAVPRMVRRHEALGRAGEEAREDPQAFEHAFVRARHGATVAGIGAGKIRCSKPGMPRDDARRGHRPSGEIRAQIGRSLLQQSQPARGRDMLGAVRLHFEHRVKIRFTQGVEDRAGRPDGYRPISVEIAGFDRFVIRARDDEVQRKASAAPAGIAKSAEQRRQAADVVVAFQCVRRPSARRVVIRAKDALVLLTIVDAGVAPVVALDDDDGHVEVRLGGEPEREAVAVDHDVRRKSRRMRDSIGLRHI